MKRKRHYLQIPHTIAPWVPGGATGDWRERIWKDVTNRGRSVVVEHLQPNERGDRSAFHGDEFYVEIGRDRQRPDTVFVLRIQSAESKLPRSIPHTLKVAILQWPGESPRESPLDLDDADTLFKQPVPTEAQQAVSVEPSPLLRSMLAKMPPATRERYRPGTQIEEPAKADDFLHPLRQLRSRHRLDSQLRLSPRLDFLLRTRTTPTELPRSERDALLEAFGLGLLNQLALDGQPVLKAVLDSVASLPIAPRLRATIWAGTLLGLRAESLRRELHACAPALSAIADVEPMSDAWQPVIIPVLSEITADQDPTIHDLLADRSGDGNLMEVLGDWAAKLAFSDSVESPTVTAPVVTEAPTVPESPSSASVTDKWVMKLRLPEPEPIESARRELARAGADLQARRTQPLTVEGLLSFHERAVAIAALASKWSQAVGDVDALRSDLNDCRAAHEELAAILGSDADALVGASYLLPSEAREISRLLSHDLLPAAPEWLLPLGADGNALRPTTQTEWAHFLVDGQRRRSIRLFCDLATELSEPQAIEWLTPPSGAGDPEPHLREWFDRVRAFLLELPVDMRELLRESPDLRRAEEEAALIRTLQDALPEAVWPELKKELTARPRSERIAFLTALNRAVAFFHDELDGVADVPYSTIRARVNKELARASERATTEPGASYGRVTVEHNYLEGRRRRATLIYVPSDTGADYGTVAVPVTLETDHPRPLTVRLDWRFKGPARTGWWKEWPDPEPGSEQIISVPIVEWRKQPDGKRWHYSLAADLPVRPPRGAHPRIEIEVTVLEAESRKPLGPPRVLRWESIGKTAVPVSVVWGDAAEPSHVREHPIGPQERADALCKMLAAGSSVAVIARRRFGKSTLVEYIVREGEKHGLCVPEAVVCTRYRTAAGFDYESLRKALSDSLVDKVGCRLKHETAAPLPGADAFDGIRTAAKKKGYRAVVILLDEAQLFFSGPEGEIGSQLKTLLERSLARTDDGAAAPVVVGLVGLPSLRDRGGADLMGLLNPVESSRMDEAQLYPLIEKMTTGLQTTRGARQELARVAGNLLILRALLESLAARATREGRLWVNHDDVAAVDELLTKGLSEGREQTVASYVRDVLNAADSVDVWRPVASLAVASAWAHVWAPARPEGDLQERALEVLNEWCRMSYEGGRYGVRPVYTMELVQQHLDQLRNRRVLERVEFASPLLRAWLVGVARRRDFDEAFRQALFSGAQRRIRVPSGAARAGEGAEAVIWRSGELAYRVRELGGSGQREEFQESVSMLAGLQQVVARREVGSDHIFDLIEMGLSEKSDAEAIQVYRWIDGRSLEQHRGALAAEKVVEIGVKLARAVRLLHRNGFLHRDICPRNIVLDDKSDPTTVRPVLIDFGFARMVTSTMRSAYAGPHIAPEVRKTTPEWGRPADVYALAWSLGALLEDGEVAERLRSWIARGMDDSAEGRPTAEAFLEGLEQLETDGKLSERREEAWREIWGCIREHRHLPWFSAQMNRSREHLVSLWLGHYRLAEQRVGVVADFLNQLTESAPSVGRSLWNLGVSGEDEGMQMLGALRNRFVHGGRREGERQEVLAKRFVAARRERQRMIVRNVADKVGKMCGLRSLPALGERLGP